MNLNYGKKNSKVLKKYYEEIFLGLCEGKKHGEIAELINNVSDEKIKPQGITRFYYDNKEYLDILIENRQNNEKEKLLDKLGLDWLLNQAYQVFYELDVNSSDLKKLPLEKKLKYAISLMNAIAKLEGKDQTVINNNHTISELNKIFEDDLNWE